MKKKLLIGCGTLLCVILLGTGAFFFLLFHRVEGQYFDSNGVTIHYTVEGKGEPVILIHGVAANADLNWRIPGVTRRLARDFQVISFDLRGHGLSGQPTDPNAYGIQIVEDITRLMDHLQLKKAHIAGYSLGGFIALKFLVTHPDRVCSAAICGSGWKDPADPSEIPNPYKPPVPREVRPAQASLNPMVWFDTVFHKVRNWAGDQLVNKAAIKALKKTYRELIVTQAELEKNTVPTICFMGTRDGLFYMAEDLAKHMANLKYVNLEGANHFTTPFYGAFKRGLLQFFVDHRGCGAAIATDLKPEPVQP